jgi:hypothetical protein
LDSDNDGVSNLDEYTQGTIPNESFSFSFDVDGDNKTRPLSDSLLILRYQFGFRGDNLINGAISPTATRKTPDEIEACFIQGGLAFDIDGSGEVRFLTVC